MKKNLLKGIVFVLVCCMMLSLFVACNNNDNDNENSNQDKNNSQNKENNKENKDENKENEKDNTENKNSNTNNNANEEELEQVNLKMYMVGAGDDDNDIVWGEINDILTERIKATVEPVVISFSDREQKVPLILASGETYDIMFLAAWNFLGTITEGAYVPLDDMLPTYGARLLENIPEAGWRTGMFEGKKYLVPKNESEYQTSGVVIREDLRVKYNAPKPMDLDSTLEYLRIMKENIPEIIPYDRNPADDGLKMWRDRIDYYRFDMWDLIFGYKVAEDGFKKVEYYLDMPEWKDWLDFARTCYEEGYWSKSMLSNQTTSEEAFQNGQTLLTARNPHTAGILAEKVESTIEGAEVGYYSIDHDSNVNLMGYKAGNAISVTSENPERALMFIDHAQNDQDIYNLIFYGIEGTHYAMTDKGVTLPDGVAGDDVKYPAYINRAFYNTSIHIQDADIWPKYEAIWDDAGTRAIGNPLVAFKIDTDPISTETAAINNLIETYVVPLDGGVIDYNEVWDEMYKAFEDAGIRKVISEIQSQLDAYHAEFSN